MKTQIVKITIPYLKKPNSEELSHLEHYCAQFVLYSSDKENCDELTTTLQQHLPEFLEKMKNHRQSNKVMIEFIREYLEFLSGKTGYLNGSDITPLSNKYCVNLESMPNTYAEKGKLLLGGIAILKLNGGLGTSMGCEGPKSLIKVKQNQTFLELTINQIAHFNKKNEIDIPLLLMNSFNTHEQSVESCKGAKITIRQFLQNEFPKIDKRTKGPVSLKNKNKEWNPPGHGNVFLSLYENGILDDLIKDNKEYVFISNIDNLGAVLDLKILGYMANTQTHYLIETTPKTSLDVKGGIVINYKDKPGLLEKTQVEPAFMSKFEDMHTFNVFNTNSIWVHIPTLKEKCEQFQIELPVIFNEKTIEGKIVVQLETAMGAAVSSFLNFKNVIVPRSRFLPVKKTDDLLLIQSDLFKVTHSGHLEKTTEAPLPKVVLSESFKFVKHYQEKIKKIPSLKNCTSLTLDGDISLDENVVLEGKVSIVLPKGKKMILKDKKIDNKSITIDESGQVLTQGL